jgi:hypothetical protein
MNSYEDFIGKKVWKNPKTTSKCSSKPFKSGFQFNTVKSITISPYTQNLAFTFEEDDSIVDCKKCSLAPLKNSNT